MRSPRANLGSVSYLMAFPGTVVGPGYANSLAGRLIGIINGIPNLIGELGLAYSCSSVARKDGIVAPNMKLSSRIAGILRQASNCAICHGTLRRTFSAGRKRPLIATH